jgi:cystathionine beta-lyase/cystathionine gamma-synthase
MAKAKKLKNPHIAVDVGPVYVKYQNENGEVIEESLADYENNGKVLHYASGGRVISTIGSYHERSKRK